MRDIAFLLCLLPIIPIAFRFPQVGVLLWVWTAVLAPNDLFYGFLASFPLGKAIVALSLPVLILSGQKKYYRLDTIFIFLIIFFIEITISATNSIADDPTNWELYSKMAKIMVLAYIISVIMGTRVRIHALIAALCLGLGFHGVEEGLQYIASGGGHIVIGIPSAGDNNSFAVAILMVIPLMVYLFRYSSVPVVKYSWLFALVISLVSVVATYSRGGFIGMVILALSFVAASKRKFASLSLLLIGVILVYTLAPDSWFARVDTIGQANNDSSFMGRVVAWKMSTLVALAHPVFGGGLHAIQNSPVWQGFAPEFPILDFIRTDAPDLTWPRAAHSIYFEVLGDMGFVGLGLFLTILFLCFRSTTATKRLAKGRADLAWAYDLAKMLQLSILVYCVSAAALSMAYFETLYILVAVISRVRSMVEVEVGVRAATGRKIVSWKLPVTAPQPDRSLVGEPVHARLQSLHAPVWDKRGHVR